MDHQLQRIVLVAKMYYEENKTQQEIANALEISRPLVSSLLARARELAIVRIEIKDPYLEDFQLLQRLKEKYRILDGTIVPKINDSDLAESVFLSHAVNEVGKLLPQASHVGVGWGSILDRIIDSIPSGMESYPDMTFCPLVGSLNSSGSGFHTNELARRFADKFSAKSIFLNAPPFPFVEQEREIYTSTMDYQVISNEYEHLDLAIVSVAAFPTVPDLASAYRLSDYTLRKRVVGEIVSFYYDQSGEFIISPTDYAIRIPLETLRSTKHVLAIIPEHVSLQAVDGILKSGVVTHIVVEEDIANGVLSL